MAGPRDIDQLQREIQELFSDLWQVPRFSGIRHGFRPQADIYRTDDPPEIHIILELPGVDPERLEIVAGERTVSVAGVRERPQLAAARVQQMELEYGPFQRQLQLIDDVDSDRATATYERGLLCIVLPIAPAPAPPPKERTAILVRTIG
jgi:HSP20 family protein